MNIKISRMLSYVLLIVIAISAIFSNTQSALASSAYDKQNSGTATISSVKSGIHNDIPEPREISGDRYHSSITLQTTRKSGRNLLRFSDHSLNDGYIVCEVPTCSSEHSVLFYQLSTYLGDVIIQYIHDQDGEKS